MELMKTNVFDYIKWRGDLSFQQCEFNEIDALILSIISYLDFSDVGEGTSDISTAVMTINWLPDDIRFNGPTNAYMRSVLELANQVARSERFHEMKIFQYASDIDEVKQMQFAAVSFLLPDETCFLAYRGTDNTLVGWKEDFNMTFVEGIPSQLEAVSYAEKILNGTNMRFRIGGHSKGGNLAIWASAHLSDENKSRLINVYSNDGPGFTENFLTGDDYLSIRDRIYYFVPESSIVGVMMEHDDDYQVISSSYPSLLQHDPFSWEVVGNHFVQEDKRSLSARQFEHIINAWVRSMSVKEREEFVDSIYDILSSSNAKTINDIDKAKIRSIISMQKSFLDLGFTKQKQLITSIGKIFFNNDIIMIGKTDSNEEMQPSKS